MLAPCMISREYPRLVASYEAFSELEQLGQLLREMPRMRDIAAAWACQGKFLESQMSRVSDAEERGEMAKVNYPQGSLPIIWT